MKTLHIEMFGWAINLDEHDMMLIKSPSGGLLTCPVEEFIGLVKCVLIVDAATKSGEM